MNATRLRILAVVCPLLSAAVAGGLVTYEYHHLARARREVASGRSELKALRERLKALRPSQPAAARISADAPGEHGH